MGGKPSAFAYPKAGPLSVALLYHTPDPERNIAVAGRVCCTELKAVDLAREMTDEEVRRILKILITSGHFAALEHATYTFGISGVSRALTHQLVRHRLASYNQQSQRYVTYGGSMEVVVPEAIAADPKAAAIFDRAMAGAYKCYQDLLEMGVPAEDARYVLPNAKTSEIVVTMNVRELLHFFELRCCKRAQWEIREMADRMLEAVSPTASYIFVDAGPSCRRGPCKEGQLTCGMPFERAPRRD